MKAAYSAHQLTRSQIRPLGDSVIVSDMVFDQRISRGGIIILNDNGTTQGIRPRWAQIYAVGPEQQEPDLQVGKWILVSHGRWTRGIDIEDETGKHTIRRIDPEDILLISDEPQNDDSMSTALLQDSPNRW